MWVISQKPIFTHFYLALASAEPATQGFRKGRLIRSAPQVMAAAYNGIWLEMGRATLEHHNLLPKHHHVVRKYNNAESTCTMGTNQQEVVWISFSPSETVRLTPEGKPSTKKSKIYFYV